VLPAQMAAMSQKHTIVLELMGEKAEQVEELKADLHDVKELYRSQISELLLQIDRLKQK